MIRLSMLTLFAAALAAAPAQAQPAASTPDYSRPANWLCLPGRADTCSKPLPTTALNPNGYGSNGPSIVARNPPVDCFYVYPTVSRDRGLNSDLIVDNSERGAAQSQLARFAGVCRTFAPIYRQLTVSAIAAAAVGTDLNAASAISYGDVAAAWRRYLAVHNRGRPFVLIGHSQGSGMLQQLIRREIEGKPIAARCSARSSRASTCWCRKAGASAARSSRRHCAARPARRTA